MDSMPGHRPLSNTKSSCEYFFQHICCFTNFVIWGIWNKTGAAFPITKHTQLWAGRWVSGGALRPSICYFCSVYDVIYFVDREWWHNIYIFFKLELWNYATSKLHSNTFRHLFSSFSAFPQPSAALSCLSSMTPNLPPYPLVSDWIFGTKENCYG